MAFDKTNPADLAALKSEVELDPLGIGWNLNNTNEVLRGLNEPDQNPGGETANQELTVRNLLTAIVPADFDHAQVSDGERRYIEAFINRDLDVSVEAWRSQIREAFRTNSTTVVNLDAMLRPMSRAEVLFGLDTVISKDEWITARDS